MLKQELRSSQVPSCVQGPLVPQEPSSASSSLLPRPQPCALQPGAGTPPSHACSQGPRVLLQPSQELLWPRAPAPSGRCSVRSGHPGDRGTRPPTLRCPFGSSRLGCTQRHPHGWGLGARPALSLPAGAAWLGAQGGDVPRSSRDAAVGSVFCGQAAPGAPFGWKRGSVLSGRVVTWAVCKGARRAKGAMETGLGTAGRGGETAPGAEVAGRGAEERPRRAELGRCCWRGGPAQRPPSLGLSLHGEGGFIWRLASQCCSEPLCPGRGASCPAPHAGSVPHGVRPCPRPRLGASS